VSSCEDCEECSSTPGYYSLGSGQTTCYDTDGYPRSCVGTGEDGERYGVSFAHSWVDNGDGTVSDLNSGLMWQQSSNGSYVAWQSALDYCNGLSLAGYSDWYLPTIGEIWQMYDYQAGTCYSVFSGCSDFWSSTSGPASPSYAYDLYTGYGYISYEDKTVAVSPARCVRFEN